LIIGCENGSSPSDRIVVTPEITATPVEHIPFITSDWVSPEVAFDFPDDSSLPRVLYALIDVQTNQVRTISFKASTGVRQPAVDARWLDDREVLLTTSLGDFVINADGSVRQVLAGSLRRTPVETAGAPPEGSWAASAEDTTITLSNRDQPRFRIVGAASFSWSPHEEVIGVLGNLCRGEDLFLFHPANGTLTNLTESLSDGVRTFAWSTDGTQIAAFVMPQASAFPRSIVLLDPFSGEIKTLVAIERLFYARSLVWNRSGSALLVRNLAFGGSVCAQPPPPTAVQPIQPP
jgi:hypothetical protein